MKTFLKKSLLGVGIVATSFSMMACHTVQGTVQGAAQDIQTVTGPASQPAPRHYYKKKRKKVTRKRTTTTTTQQTADTGNQSTDTQTTQQQSQADTDSSTY